MTTHAEGPSRHGSDGSSGATGATGASRAPGRGAAATNAGGAITLEDFGLEVARKTLLRDANAIFPAGRITLIVGASGAGKSVFLNTLAGLVRHGHEGYRVRGRMRIGGRDRFGDSSRIRVGIVFQNFALFDELSATGNVEFGRDHRDGARRAAGDGPPYTSAAALLDSFGVPATVPVALLSGGQKQRLAIARTLAYDPDVVVYDEPTSGLDPANARLVAERIRDTQSRYSRTTVIVTHDYWNLAPIAERIFHLDHQRQQLVAVEPGDLERTVSHLGARTAPSDAPAEPAPAPRRSTVWSRTFARLGDTLDGTTRTFHAALLCLLNALPLWRSPRWGLRYLAHYLLLLASPSAFAYFGAAGCIAGLVATHFTFKFLPFKAYTEPLVTEELLHGLGFSLFRIVIPVLLTVLLAARGGAAIAADVGTRSYSRQIDALRSFHVNPHRYLLTNVLYASLLATPLLVAFGFAVARLTSLAVFAYDYPQHSPLFWDGHFHRHLREPGRFLYLGGEWTLAKVLCCGVGIGAIAYFQGLRPKASGVAVSRSITATIIWATLLVLCVHLVFAFLEF